MKGDAVDAVLLEKLKEDLEKLVNKRVVIRLDDNEETVGQLMSVGSLLVEMVDESDKRNVRLRMDLIRSVDDPPEEGNTEAEPGEADQNPSQWDKG